MSVLTLKGPRWVTVRQHRRALWALPAAVAASLAVVLALRWWASSPSGLRSANPDGALRSAMDHAGTGLLLLPLLLGAFVAGPMIARELESGTYRLALTQSSTPRAWLSAKITLAAAAAVASSAALAGVYRVGRLPLAGTHQFSWADRGPYEALGTVLVAYCLLGVAVGALVGQLVRRTLAAMAVTGLVTGLVMAVLGAVRWSFLPVRTLTTSVVERGVPMPSGDFLMMDTGLVTASGERLPEWTCFARSGRLGVCPEDLDVTGWYLDYHPAAHYWPTQSIETAVVLALAALALRAAFAVLRTRHR
ncbi:ABC transporter permease [Streptomyces sp. NRRL F-2580]|uniref:ABC transporter permease n=1 Tax=Streptomyces sp. NRRL F-2580 TaxID=1463841 RepID=UPI0004CC1E87|nr:ABC transporter permease [Streptomyces sp. NRRL F-2580]